MLLYYDVDMKFELKKTFCRNVLSKNVYSTTITLYINIYIYIYIYIYIWTYISSEWLL